MKKIIGLLLFLTLWLVAEFEQVPATEDFLKSGIKVIDIRTPSEWYETGIVKGSIPIMFFDEKGSYDVDSFLKQLNGVVKKDEKFALICRTGSRTSMVAGFLSQELGYKAVNLQGGIMYLMQQGYKPTPYKK